MPNVIEFALGLQANQFLSQLGLSNSQLLSFAGTASLVRDAFGKMWSAIEMGGQLQDLSLRTGETVDELVKLQAAFGQIGSDAGNVPMTLQFLQRFLAGVTDNGEDAAAILAQIGINLNDLRGQSGSEQILRIAEGLSKLDKEMATGLAMKIGGRGGSSVFLQASRDLEGFKTGLEGAAATAGIFGRNAKAFDDLGDSISLLKLRFEGFWAGIASGVAPILQQIESKIAGYNWEEVGQSIGNVIANAVGQSKVSELLKLSFLAAGSELSAILQGALVATSEGFSAALQDIFETTSLSFSDLVEYFTQAIIASVDLIGTKLPMLGGYFEEKLTERMTRIQELAAEGGAEGFFTISARASKKSFQEFMNMQSGIENPYSAALRDLISSLNVPIPGQVAGANGASSGKLAIGGAGSVAGGQAFESNPLERIGAIFARGVGSADYNREIARNTGTLVDLFRKWPREFSIENAMGGHIE